MRLLSISDNGFIWNGLRFNGFRYNGLRYNGLDAPSDEMTKGWNSVLLPQAFGKDSLGTSNWIDPDNLGPDGVGDLSRVPGIENNVLDNRHIHSDLKDMLCDDDGSKDTEEVSFRDYFRVLLDLAWPSNANLHICCSQPAGREATSACLDPDLTFSVSGKDEDNIEPLALAPHFLTQKFEHGQQEALTAALIAKLNVHGTPLRMDLAGYFDLGAAGTRLIAREDPEHYHHALGRAWGNMFLDCLGSTTTDVDTPFCQASLEKDRTIGRDPAYHANALFTCTGGSNYPTKVSGKSCFSQDMKTNAADGCELVAAAGNCGQVCVGGFCGIHEPPMEGEGTTNVLYVYMSDYPKQDKTGLCALYIALPIAMAAFLVALLFIAKKKKAAGRTTTPAAAESGKAAPGDEEDIKTVGSSPED